MPSSKDNITRTLREYFKIWGEFEINDDDTITVRGTVEVSKPIIGHLPVKFREVTERFLSGGRLFSMNSLEGCPTIVGEHFSLLGSDVDSLLGIPRKAQSMSFAYRPFLGLLPLVNCQCDQIRVYNTHDNDSIYLGKCQRARKIVNRYVGGGPKAALAMAIELVSAGLETNAHF